MSSLQTLHRQAHIALNRFGLGAKPGGVFRIHADAKAAVLAELETPDIADITTPGLPNYLQACRAVDRDFQAGDTINRNELTARIAKHTEPEVGFVERLVLFFSNHFSMSMDKDGAIRTTIGQLERDVIRRNVLGSFKTMLQGVMKHPAMLRYLDNCDSIGPNSRIGLSWGVGLNHNLAREICELHTLGVNGGYTEDDIDSLAAALTGWSYVRGWEADYHYNGGTPVNRGQFLYRPTWHEPGTKQFMGQRFVQRGIDQAAAILDMLAVHPSTAQFIAFKLVHHFISDEPTPAMVNPVATAFLHTKGNLKAVAKALVNLPEAWAWPPTKIRTPYELQIAEFRAVHKQYPDPKRWPFESALYALNNYPWQHLTPDGYTDESDYWMSPDAMRIRLETAQLNADTLLDLGAYRQPAADLADALFGQALSDASRQAMAGAVSRRDGLTTLFMIPEFQRR